MSKYTPRLKNDYRDRIAPGLKERFQYSSVMQVPRLTKIVLSQGLGDATADKKIIENALTEMTTISGQKAIVTYAKKDVSNFKLRKGMPIGAKVTLRGDMMFQ
jgi:large subunit ribosomal protein L5